MLESGIQWSDISELQHMKFRQRHATPYKIVYTPV